MGRRFRQIVWMIVVGVGASGWMNGWSADQPVAICPPPNNPQPNNVEAANAVPTHSPIANEVATFPAGHGPEYENRHLIPGPTRSSVVPSAYKGDWRDIMISQYEATLIQRQRHSVYGSVYGPVKRKSECVKAWFSYIAGHGPVVWVRD